MRGFCTCFDHRYLSRGLALYQSLRRHCPSFRLWVLCLDDICLEALTRLAFPEIQPISLAEFERHDAPLRAAKQNRSRVEYYFTLTPSLPLFVLHRVPSLALITYVDADLYFFHDPSPVFDELAGRSIAIIEHRFMPHLQWMERNGRYNVGWLSFRADTGGLACLRRWRQQCLDWCYDRVEPGRFADQKYLDEWPDRFAGVAVIGHPGANLAPWNFGNHRLRVADARVWVDDQPLLFYHFQGLKRLNGWIVDTNLRGYRTRPSAVLRRAVYRPYIRALDSLARTLPPAGQAVATPPADGRRPALPLRKFGGRGRRWAGLARDLATGTCLIAPGRALW